jgi:hypothetical protein
MKVGTSRLALALAIVAGGICPLSALAQTEAGGTPAVITYQGEARNASGQPLQGAGEVRLELFDLQSGGVLKGTAGPYAVTFNDGIFTADSVAFTPNPPATDAFGTGAEPRWLQISVRAPGSGAFVTLAPRQRLTQTPFAKVATKALGVDASGLSGTLSAAFVSGNSLVQGNTTQTISGAKTFNNASNVFVGNGAGLTNVAASSYAGPVSDGQLSSNVALLGRLNQVFTQDNNFAARLGVGTLPTEKFDLAAGSGSFVRFTSSAGDMVFNGGSDGVMTFGNLGLSSGRTQFTNSAGTSLLSILNSNGNVGIGTTSPSQKLTVQDGAIAVANTTDNKAYAFNYDSTGDYFYLDEVGTARHLALRNGGFLGIGTTTPGLGTAVGQAFDKVEIAGPDVGLRIKNINDTGGGVLWNSFGTLHLGIYNPAASGNFGQVAPLTRRSFFSIANDGRVGSATNTGGSPVFRNLLDNGSGQMGIGTTAPQESVSIVGGLNVDQDESNNGNLVINNRVYGISFGSLAGEGIGSARTVGAPNRFGLDFYTGGAGIKRMSITSAGLVGIGTVSPATLLDVNGTITSRGTDFILKGRGGGQGNNANNARALVDGGWGTGSIAGGGLLINYANDFGRVVVDSDLRVNGRATVNELEITGGSDLAEAFDVNAHVPVEPGMVVVIDPNRPGELMLTDVPYDARVAGVISGANNLKPGMLMAAKGEMHADGKHPVALTGRVWTWCDASAGPIKPGDRLTTSATPGHAQRAGDPSAADGAVIGKAMTSLESGRGLVLVLVNLQ